MDLNVDPNSTHAAVAHTATMEVGVEDAERLALAAQAGTLSLALRRTGSAEVQAVRPMQTSDLSPGGAPHALAQSSPQARRSHKSHGAVAGPTGSSVIVVHGDSSSSVSVPAERFGAGV